MDHDLIDVLKRLDQDGNETGIIALHIAAAGMIGNIAAAARTGRNDVICAVLADYLKQLDEHRPARADAWPHWRVQ
jgi:hypothetical protein